VVSWVGSLVGSSWVGSWVPSVIVTAIGTQVRGKIGRVIGGLWVYVASWVCKVMGSRVMHTCTAISSVMGRIIGK
jgi:hypothetical protein